MSCLLPWLFLVSDQPPACTKAAPQQNPSAWAEAGRWLLRTPAALLLLRPSSSCKSVFIGVQYSLVLGTWLLYSRRSSQASCGEEGVVFGPRSALLELGNACVCLFAIAPCTSRHRGESFLFFFSSLADCIPAATFFPSYFFLSWRRSSRRPARRCPPRRPPWTRHGRRARSSSGTWRS